MSFSYMVLTDKKVKEFLKRCADKMRESKKSPSTCDCWERELISMLKPAQLSSTTVS